MDPAIEEVVLNYATDELAHGQVLTSNERRKAGVLVSASGARSIWLRHDLACFKQHRKAPDAYVTSTSDVLTESQIPVLEHKHEEKGAH